MTPLARTDRLSVRELPDEIIVFDLATRKAHCLNAVAACVWKHCDGRRDVAALVQAVHRQLGVPADEALVRLALEQLSRRNLLTEPVARPDGEALTRRTALRRLVVAAVTLPAIMTVTASKARAGATVLGTPTNCDGEKDNTALLGGQMICCGGKPITNGNDPNNCGRCGNVCAAGTVCTNGACAAPVSPPVPTVPTCAGKPDGTPFGPGEICCGGTPVLPNLDPNNCGGCGRKCAVGQFCINGVCTGPVCGQVCEVGVGGCPPGCRCVGGPNVGDPGICMPG